MKSSMESGSADWLASPLEANVPGPMGTVERNMRLRGFGITHLWLPLIAFLALAVPLMGWQGDEWIADRVYASEGHRWTLVFNFVTEHLIHKLGRDISAAAWLCVLLAWIASRTRPRLSHWRQPLAYLALSTLLATALVAWVKSWSNMDCPWDLVRYGGERAYVGLFDLRPIGLSRGSCFPAGHASAGYAWVALYFFFLATRPRWRWLGLATGIGSGLLFGFSQQLRGAHFLSHDVWSAAICWLTALGVYASTWRKSGVAMHLARAASGADARSATPASAPWLLAP